MKPARLHPEIFLNKEEVNLRSKVRISSATINISLVFMVSQPFCPLGSSERHRLKSVQHPLGA
jgi:hypothetical protein